jgi:hypothetical protein
LPPGKLCNARRDDPWESAPEQPRSQEERVRSHVAIATNEEGAFTFTLDSRSLPPGRTLVIFTQYDGPEHGQGNQHVASIAAIWAQGDFERCELVDGSIEGWPFQEGAPPGN